MLMPAKRVSKIFPGFPEDEHLHIVVEHSTTGEFRFSPPRFLFAYSPQPCRPSRLHQHINHRLRQMRSDTRGTIISGRLARRHRLRWVNRKSSPSCRKTRSKLSTAIAPLMPRTRFPHQQNWGMSPQSVHCVTGLGCLTGVDSA